MSSKCVKCDKTVYPMEQLSYLEMMYHKGCFKCTDCNTSLSTKTAKSHQKQPYCNTHLPKDKPTSTCDSIDQERARTMTQQQSKVKYLEGYEKQKGHYTSLADDPEILRAKQNAINSSDLSYKHK